MNEAVAYLSMNMKYALLVWDVNDEYIQVSLNEGTKRWYKLYSTNKGFYFNYKGSRFYIHEFIRTDVF